MLKLSQNYTYIGDRDFNLDRIGHFIGKDCSFSYMLDGFIETNLHNNEPHYVDFLVKKIEISIKEISLYPEIKDFLKILVLSINEKTSSKGKASAVFVLSKGEDINIFYAGDTRYYLLKEKIRSKDHSQAQKMIDEKISPENSIYKHPYRKYITNSISSECSFSNLENIKFKSINNLILCTDGFWNCFSSDDEIYNISTAEQVQDAFNKAKKYNKGKADNISLMYLTKNI